MTNPTPESERFLHVRGDTFRYKQELRDMFGVYDREAAAWRIPWSQRVNATTQVSGRWHGCTLHCQVPALPIPRPDAVFVRLRLASLPCVLNCNATRPVVGDWYDVEECVGLLRCHPVLGEGRERDFFVCLSEALDRHFESQV